MTHAATARPMPPDRRGARALAAPAGALALWAALVGAAAALQAASGVSHSLCAFRQTTGHPCATCGGTRASIALASGRPLDALAYNPLVTLGLLAGVTWLTASLAARRPLTTDLFHRRTTWGVLGALLAANWLYVLLAGHV